jgi:glutathione peroxidase-family protein
MHDFTMDSIAGESVDLSGYAGKVCLVVNVASE